MNSLKLNECLFFFDAPVKYSPVGFIFTLNCAKKKHMCGARVKINRPALLVSREQFEAAIANAACIAGKCLVCIGFRFIKCPNGLIFKCNHLGNFPMGFR